MKSFKKFVAECFEQAELDEAKKVFKDLGFKTKAILDDDGDMTLVSTDNVAGRQMVILSKKQTSQIGAMLKTKATKKVIKDLGQGTKISYDTDGSAVVSQNDASGRNMVVLEPSQVKQIRGMMNEEVELDEAVEVRHDRYMRSHGKKASGGTGSWMFTHKNMGDVDYNNEKEVYSAPRGKFSDAKKAAQQWGKKHGHSTVYVMEEVELDEGYLKYGVDRVPDAYINRMPKALQDSLIEYEGTRNSEMFAFTKKLKTHEVEFLAKAVDPKLNIYSVKYHGSNKTSGPREVFVYEVKK